MLTIRTFQPADHDAVRELFARGQMDFAQGLEDVVQAYIRRSLADDLADISANYLSDPGSHFWVADVDAQVKGMVGIQWRSEEEAELRRMSVASDTRRQGIGGKLLETTDAFCREQGYQRIRLSTVTQLQPAIAMYRKSGYQLTGEEQHGRLTVYHFLKDL
ncbi:MAG: GNAT family N-acetyltransferase [Dehalococcoidia bacterium]